MGSDLQGAQALIPTEPHRLGQQAVARVAHRLVGPGHDGHLLHVEAGGQLGDGPMSGDRFS